MKDYDWSRHYLQSDYNRITFALLFEGILMDGGDHHDTWPPVQRKGRD